MKWTKEEAASAWCRGILGTPAIVGMCKKRNWDFAELRELRQKKYDSLKKDGAIK